MEFTPQRLKDLEKIYLLIRQGGINQDCENENTSLFIAIKAQDVQLTKALIKNGADLNWTDFNGDSALMIATSNNTPAIVQLLVDAGADLNIRNKEGYSALTHAAVTNHSEVMGILIKAKANIEGLESALLKGQKTSAKYDRLRNKLLKNKFLKSIKKK